MIQKTLTLFIILLLSALITMTFAYGGVVDTTRGDEPQAPRTQDVQAPRLILIQAQAPAFPFETVQQAMEQAEGPMQSGPCGEIQVWSFDPNDDWRMWVSSDQFLAAHYSPPVETPDWMYFGQIIDRSRLKVERVDPYKPGHPCDYFTPLAHH